MCFKRLVLNVCNLSVALNEKGKLLNLVENIRLYSEIHNNFFITFRKTTFITCKMI